MTTAATRTGTGTRTVNRGGDNWRRIRAIAWKDLTTERRSKAGFNAVVSLGITILVLFGFALGPDAQVLRDAAPGAWPPGRLPLSGGCRKGLNIIAAPPPAARAWPMRPAAGPRVYCRSPFSPPFRRLHG